MPCFKDFDVYSICVRSGSSWMGGASGEECCRKSLEEGGYLGGGGCIGEY